MASELGENVNKSAIIEIELLSSELTDVITAILTFIALVTCWLLSKYVTSWSNDETQSSSLRVRRQRLAEAQSVLIGDLAVYIAGGVVAIVTTCSFDVITHHQLQLTVDWKQPRLLQLSAAASVGHFVFRLLHKLVSSSACTWMGFDVIGYVIGIVAAISVIWTRSLSLIAVTGLLYQVPLAIFSLARVIRYQDENSSGICYPTLYAIGVISSVLCMIIVPTVLTAYCVLFIGVHVSNISIWLAVVSTVSLVWMLLFGVWFFCVTSRNLWRYLTDRNNLEKRYLLSQKNLSPSIYSNLLVNSTVP